MDDKKNKSLTPQSGNDENTSSEVVNISLKYPKRQGTSIMMARSMYKTNILSLMLYRTLVDKRIDFVLGCNVDEIGTMSEICYRFKADNHQKPIVAFVRTKYKDAITDKEWNNAKSDFSSLKCFQNFLLIKDRFHANATDPLFKGNFDDVEPYLIIHTLNSCNMKNCIPVSKSDKIFTNSLNSIINSNGDMNKIFKIDHGTTIDDIIYDKIEYIGKIIAAYAVFDDGDSKNVQEEMLNVINKYYNFLIPDVIKINELNGNWYGEISDSQFGSSDKYHIRLKRVLFKEVLRSSKVNIDKISSATTKKLIKIAITSKMYEVIETLKATDSQNIKKCFENDIQAATQFFDSLYIYSEQCKDMAEHIKKEVAGNEYLRSRSPIFGYQPELVYLQLHNKVQKWWLLQDEQYYLTNDNCNFVKLDTVVELPQLCILNLRFKIQVDGLSFKFNTDSLELFKDISSDQNNSMTVIKSNDVLLSCMKLAQYFDQSHKSCMIVDFEHVSSMTENEFNTITEELSKAFNIDTFVIVMHQDVNNKLIRLHNIVEVFTKNIVIVSKSTLFDFDTVPLIHDTNNLSDIENADEFLNYKIIVQGVEDKLEVFINGNMKKIVNAGILSKIMRQERIEIGRNLSDSTYDKMKDYFVERKLRNDDKNSESVKELSILLDIQEPVVTIIAAPGMGKSKLLTHVSVKTKYKFPSMWIIRMNLLDYIAYFDNWYKYKTVISLKESISLICMAEIGSDDKFKLEFIDGVLVLDHHELKGTKLLHLELIIASFNEGYVYFIFDGFDEICPHYGKVVVEFMKCFVDYHKHCEILSASATSTSSNSKSNPSKVQNRHRVWISSRPYNTIQSTLIKEFATPFYLEHLSKDEQKKFYHKYWEDHLKVEMLSKEQFENVEAFFEYMNQYRQSGDMQLKLPTTSVVPLRLMHEAAVDYFRDKILTSSMDNNKEEILNRWISNDELQTLDKCNARRRYLEGLKLAGTPLHMHIYADLFVSEIKGSSWEKRNWEPDVHTFEFYERFLETKLMKIRFEEKCGEKVHSATSKIFYDDEKKKFIEDHKWLALHATFRETLIIDILEPRKMNYVHEMIAAIRKGEEKTGLIDRIQDGVPRFVHLVFAEYFAVECVADLLKTSTIFHLHILIDFTINIFLKLSAGIMTVFDRKVQKDEIFRKRLMETQVMKFIFGTMMRKRSSRNRFQIDSSYIISDNTTLVRLLENGCLHTAKLLLQSIEKNLNTVNIKTTMAYIDRDFFVLAIKYEGLIEYLLNTVREVDPSSIIHVLDKCGLNELTEFSNNEEIKNQMYKKFTPQQVT